MKLSLLQRLLLASSLVLALFLGLAGWSVDQAAQERARTALKERLLGQVYALLGVAEENAEGLPRIPEVLSDPLLQQPDSGLYAQVIGINDDYRWQSGSMLDRKISELPQDIVGTPVFLQRHGLLIVDLIVEWEALDANVYPYHISVAFDLQAQSLAVADFRRVLWQWLGGAGLILLMVQLLLLRWGLKPVNTLAADVAELESGERQLLTREVPVELAGLQGNLNSLVKHNRALLERHRNRLADLAHSLKTPLSVLAACAEERDTENWHLHAREQLPKMNELVDYHLQHAAVSGGGLLNAAIDIKAEINSLISALEKVYRSRNIQLQSDLPTDLHYRIDKGDFYEMVGNLLENSFKYCRSRVLVRAGIVDERLVLDFEDDGPGVPAEQLARLLQRGARADQKLPGQGIGLSVVDEIIVAYQGEMTVSESNLGGARFSVKLGSQ